MTTTVVTDRTAIAAAIAAGLGELDQLRDRRAEADAQVEQAQQQAERATEAYIAKFDEVLATGWATAEGLAAQGHQLPKTRRPAKTKKNPTAADAETGNNVHNGE